MPVITVFLVLLKTNNSHDEKIYLVVIKSVLSNYSARILSVMIAYLLTPIYIKQLGVNKYGLISFQNTMLGFVLIADFGLSTAFARQMALTKKIDIKIANLLAAVEKFYCALVVVILILIIGFGDWLVMGWLKNDPSLNKIELITCLILMGVICCSQLWFTLYYNGMLGSDFQTRANYLQVLFSTARSGLVILPVAFYPNIFVFLGWQCVIGMLFVLWIREKLWRQISCKSNNWFDIDEVVKIWPFASGIFLIGIISAVNTQIDKLVISRYLSLEDLARYSLAGILAQLPSIATLPIAVSVLPKMTKWITGNEHEVLEQTYLKFSYIVTSISSILAVAVILNAKIILDAWTKSYVVSNDAELVAQVLTIGNCFLAIQYMPYHLAMAHGHSSTNLKIGFWFLIFNPIITVLMVKNYGLIGAALPWPFVNLAGGVILGTLVTKRFLNKRVSEWWLKSVLAPLSVTLIVNLIVYSNSIAKSFGTGDWMVHTFLSVISGLLFLLYGYKLLFNQRLRC